MTRAANEPKYPSIEWTMFADGDTGARRKFLRKVEEDKVVMAFRDWAEDYTHRRDHSSATATHLREAEIVTIFNAFNVTESSELDNEDRARRKPGFQRLMQRPQAMAMAMDVDSN